MTSVQQGRSKRNIASYLQVMLEETGSSSPERKPETTVKGKFFIKFRNNTEASKTHMFYLFPPPWEQGRYYPLLQTYWVSQGLFRSRRPNVKQGGKNYPCVSQKIQRVRRARRKSCPFSSRQKPTRNPKSPFFVWQKPRRQKCGFDTNFERELKWKEMPGFVKSDTLDSECW